MLIEFLHTNTDGSKRIITGHNPILKIGKDSRSNIVLSSGSRMHAVLEHAPGDDYYTLVDLGGEPRTKVNGVEVNKSKIVVGSKIQIGVDVLFVEHIGEHPTGTAKPLGDITKKEIPPPCPWPPKTSPASRVSFEEFPFTQPPQPKQKKTESSPLYDILKVSPEEFDEVIKAIGAIDPQPNAKEEDIRHALYLWAKLLNDLWAIKEVAYTTIEKLIRADNRDRAIKMVEGLKKDQPLRTFAGMWRKLNEKQ